MDRLLAFFLEFVHGSTFGPNGIIHSTFSYFALLVGKKFHFFSGDKGLSVATFVKLLEKCSVFIERNPFLTTVCHHT
jgi:hypothetical protein